LAPITSSSGLRHTPMATSCADAAAWHACAATLAAASGASGAPWWRAAHPSRGAVRLLRCRSRARRLRGAPLRRRRHRPGDLQAGAQAILAQADELARASGLPPTAPLVLLGQSRGAKTCALAAALSSSNGSSSGVGQQRQPRCVASLVLIRPGGRDRARPVVSARHKSRLERASRGRKPRVGPRRVSCGGSLVCIEKVSHKQ